MVALGRVRRNKLFYSVQQFTDSLQQPSAQQVSLQQVSILSDNSFITELPC